MLKVKRTSVIYAQNVCECESVFGVIYGGFVRRWKFLTVFGLKLILFQPLKFLFKIFYFDLLGFFLTTTSVLFLQFTFS